MDGIPFLNLPLDHFGSSWGSFRGQDHFRSGIISGLGIISGPGSFQGLYRSPTHMVKKAQQAVSRRPSSAAISSTATSASFIVPTATYALLVPCPRQPLPPPAAKLKPAYCTAVTKLAAEMLVTECACTSVGNHAMLQISTGMQNKCSLQVIAKIIREDARVCCPRS